MRFFIKILLVVLLGTITPFLSYAQKSTDEQLAAQFYNNKEYDKAVVYYQKLYDKSALPTHYIRLLNCYLELTEFKNAEKLVKHQIKKNPLQLEFWCDLAYVYKQSGDEIKSNQTNEKALKMLIPSNEQIISLAKGYLKYKETVTLGGILFPIHWRH